MKISLAALNAASADRFVAALGGIVEHAAWVAEEAAGRRPFASLAELFAAMRDIVLAAGGDRRMSVLQGHPQLAGLAARSGSMTSDSISEQAGAGLDALSAERARLFDNLNADYLGRHGFPFIIAVRRHGADSILREFRRRCAQPREAEIETALAEVVHIVALRLDGIVEASDALPVSGRLSTHVLDTASGVPAEGVDVELVELVLDGPVRRVAAGTTNADGRTDTPLVDHRPVPVATYELRFALGAYFRRRGTSLADPAFLDVVPIRFGVAEPEGHYHVPLAATPWSYQTYRGS